MRLSAGQTCEVNVLMHETSMLLDNVVVTASKYETKQKEAAGIVNMVSPVMFETTSSNSMADVLNYQTGLRVEMSCSNCGVPQLRINGLEGQYSQILMDSRPIFSSLASVYGLEQVPAGMVDRVEVIRGGGSALYGANAIAGVVNIITKEPSKNFVNVNHTSSYMENNAYDINTAVNASVVTPDRKAGLFLFAVQRNRKQYDRDDDGFSDIPKLNSTTAGFRGFFKVTDYSKLNFGVAVAKWNYRRTKPIWPNNCGTILMPLRCVSIGIRLIVGMLCRPMPTRSTLDAIVILVPTKIRMRMVCRTI